MESNRLLFIDQRSMGFVLILLFFFLISFLSPTHGFDVLDPNGNITIKWDVMQESDGTQDVRVYIFNYQLFRHIEHPGWKLSWEWRGSEAIWNIWGAEATEQGNCYLFNKGKLPHCCDKRPVIIDLMPGAPYNKQVANCCKEGVLSSMTQHPHTSMAAFRMNIGISFDNDYSSLSNTGMPGKFDLGLPGYTCGDPFEVLPSKFVEETGSQRQTQALVTWNVTCSYSQFRASPTSTCCVSFSAFYNDTIIPCPKCSCGCQEQQRIKCSRSGELLPVLQLPPDEARPPVVQCTNHMCPIKVHWHVKQSYKQYWRVKVTVTNLNYVKNYTDWSLVVQHPNLRSLVQIFSFNYKPLNQYGYINDTGVFYGIEYYNDMLLQSGEKGNVQTEMLLHKDPGIFTFSEGWAFPRKISFNGDQCVLPSPDDYPRLPNTAPLLAASPQTSTSIVLVSLFLVIVTF